MAAVTVRCVNASEDGVLVNGRRKMRNKTIMCARYEEWTENLGNASLDLETPNRARARPRYDGGIERITMRHSDMTHIFLSSSSSFRRRESALRTSNQSSPHFIIHSFKGKEISVFLSLCIYFLFIIIIIIIHNLDFNKHGFSFQCG